MAAIYGYRSELFCVSRRAPPINRVATASAIGSKLGVSIGKGSAARPSLSINSATMRRPASVSGCAEPCAELDSKALAIVSPATLPAASRVSPSRPRNRGDAESPCCWEGQFSASHPSRGPGISQSRPAARAITVQRLVWVAIGEGGLGKGGTHFWRQRVPRAAASRGSTTPGRCGTSRGATIVRPTGLQPRSARR
jgi:hypothetical protein